MGRAGFLSPEDPAELIALARNGSAASRLTRRTHAIVLLDAGWSGQQVAAVLVRRRHDPQLAQAYEARGIGLVEL